MEKKFFTVAELSNMKFEIVKTFESAKKAHEKYPEDDTITYLYERALGRMKEVTDIIRSLEDGDINKLNNYMNDDKNIKGTDKLYVKA